MPLEGHCVLVTRASHQAAQLTCELESHGATVEEFPLIRISAPDSWIPFDQAFADLSNYSWLLFASANAVETALTRAQHLNVSEQLKTKNIACIGPSTAATLLRYGIQAKFTPTTAIAESFIEEFSSVPYQINQGSKRIIWPKTNVGRTVIKRDLEKLGWQVDIVQSYKTEGPEDPQGSAKRLLTLLQSGKLSVITLSSSETVRIFREILSLATLNDKTLEVSLLAKSKLAVIGPETAKACQSIFGRVDIRASEFTVHGLVAALVDEYRNEQV